MRTFILFALLATALAQSPTPIFTTEPGEDPTVEPLPTVHPSNDTTIIPPTGLTPITSLPSTVNPGGTTSPKPVTPTGTSGGPTSSPSNPANRAAEVANSVAFAAILGALFL